MEAGTWKARAREAELGYASTGTEQVAVLFEIVEGPYLGERITWYGYFTEGTFDRTVEGLRNAGWTGNDLSDLSSLGSRDCFIVVEWDTYNGERSLKVRWVNSGNGLALKQAMGDAEKRAFAARQRARVAAIGGGAGAAAQPRLGGHQGATTQRGGAGARSDASGWTGKPVWLQTVCAECGKRQYTTPTGHTCENRHQNARGIPQAPPPPPPPSQPSLPTGSFGRPSEPGLTSQSDVPPPDDDIPF